MINLKFIRYFKDVLRFNQLSKNDNKICVYCEGKNYWPHLKPIVEHLLKRTDMQVNYVSSSEDDPGLRFDHPKLQGYVIGAGFIRNYFFDNLSSDVVIMTMPDLDQYQVKKSARVKRFVYIHHSLVSHQMVYRPKAFDAFDVIMCAGPHHNTEIQQMIKSWHMPPKTMINHGYGRLDSIISNSKEKPHNVVKKILVAPSWGSHGTLEMMGERLIDELMKLNLHVILRPHPQTVKFAKGMIDTIVKKYQNHERFSYEQGVSSEASLHQSDLMISDWSGAALDYAFGLLKPVLFIDVPKKVQNEQYESLGLVPFEVSIREQIGVVQDVDLMGLEQKIMQLLNDETDWASALLRLRDQHVYNVSNSGQIAADAILELL